MARIRSVHPGLYTDEGFISLSIEARLFYIGIWSEADDQGAFAWKPFTLKARILPADNVDAKALLQEMVDIGVVKEALDGEKPIGLIKNFCKWQRPKKPSLFFEIPDHLRSFVGLDDEAEENRSKRKAIWARFNGRCFYCGSEVSYYSKRHDSLEIDHVTPVSKGGSDDASNLVCACRGCNRSKKDMSASEFFAFRKLKKLPVSEGFAKSFGNISHPENVASDSESDFSHPENGFRVTERRKGGREEGKDVGCNRATEIEKPIADRWQELAEDVIAATGNNPARSMVRADCVRQWLADASARGYSFETATEIILGTVREKSRFGGKGKPPAWFNSPVTQALASGTIPSAHIVGNAPKSRADRVADAWAGVPDIPGV
ncbi:hypothetical protein WSS15_23490 [Acetobacter pasteurianus]|uniref:HNH endonuclease n=1 Tax=Acetobacter pasteurianus TaxID=438 RepID=UPI0022C98EFD|nr:HNH endonuclease signature motif containing protein [Acetobacter pasteurianus]GLH29699.1 hypothetical protein WSS15_23490 [Acetobacter pasteurianus]